MEEPLQDLAVGKPCAEVTVGKTRKRAGDVRPKRQHAEVGEALQACGGGGIHVDPVFRESEVDEILLQSPGREDQVDTLEQSTLFAVIQRTVNARKCWTKGRLVGKAFHGSGVGLL